MKIFVLCLFIASVACAAVSVGKEAEISVGEDGSFEIPVKKTIPLPKIFIPRLLAAIKEHEGGDQKALAATINDWVDVLLENISEFMIHHGLDPVEMPEIHESFEYKPLWITYHGELDLTEGWLQELTTISRLGDANIAYDNRILTIALPLSFKNLQFNYDYSAKIMNLGPKGGVDGNIKSMRISVVIDIDLKNFQINLTRFKITDTGKISFKFTGNVLTDWLLNLLTKVVTTILHNTVTKIISNIVGGEVARIIDSINEAIAGLLGQYETMTPLVGEVLKMTDNNIILSRK